MHYDNDLILRLHRIAGQVNGVLRMMEEGRECQDVVTQLSAIRNATERVTVLMIGRYMAQCLREEGSQDPEAIERHIEEAVRMLVRSS
ncbi:MAG: metal-sensing transcriptional repressor [Firmicutes bacterium]|nr:metal-sensing transcriptional repressor [Bacillota bacterium]